jgi:hypothetical protein
VGIKINNSKRRNNKIMLFLLLMIFPNLSLGRLMLSNLTKKSLKANGYLMANQHYCASLNTDAGSLVFLLIKNPSPGGKLSTTFVNKIPLTENLNFQQFMVNEGLYLKKNPSLNYFDIQPSTFMVSELKLKTYLETNIDIISSVIEKYPKIIILAQKHIIILERGINFL